MIKNCTPHVINVQKRDGSFGSFQPEEKTPRVETRTKYVCDIDGIPVVETVYGDIADMPSLEDGVYFIVSKMLRDQCRDRNDLLTVGELIRDQRGIVIGCKGLST